MNKLVEYKQGDRVKILKIKGSGRFKNRLMEMGFLKGENIEIVKYAPLQDPMEIKMKGYNLSLRLEEAENIEVEQV